MQKKEINLKKLLVIVGVLIMLFVGNILLSQSIMSLNLTIKKTQEEIQINENQIQQLKVIAAKYTSNQYLLKQAKELGFRETVKVLYLSEAEILAKND